MTAADRDRLVAALADVEEMAMIARVAVRSQERHDEKARRTDAEIAAWVRELATKQERLRAVADAVLGGVAL